MNIVLIKIYFMKNAIFPVQKKKKKKKKRIIIYFPCNDFKNQNPEISKNQTF